MMSLETVFYYLDCLANSNIMLNKVYAVKYIPELAKVVSNKLLNAPE